MLKFISKNLNALHRIRKIILFWVLFITYIFFLLVGPRVPDNEQEKYCVRNFEINSTLGHSMNCDSADWILNSSNPSRIFEPESIRQTRPAMIFTTHYLSKFLDIFYNDKEYPKTTQYVNASGESNFTYEEFNPKIVYVSYLIINVLILISSIAIFFKIFNFSILNYRCFDHWYIWFANLIICNNTVNQFLYSPSTKFFNILCAVITIFLSIKIFKNQFSKFINYITYFGLGILMLFYASFFITFVTLISLHFFNRRHDQVYKIVYEMIVLTFIFCLPYIIWFSYIQNLNNSFYISNFTNYKFIIWIFEFYKLNGLILTIQNLFLDFLKFTFIFLKEHYLLAIFLPLFLFIKNKICYKDKLVYFFSIFFSFIFICFFIILGHTPSDIISILIIPFAICLTNFFKNNQISFFSNSATPIFIIILGIYNIWSLTKFGPYS